MIREKTSGSSFNFLEEFAVNPELDDLCCFFLGPSAAAAADAAAAAAAAAAASAFFFKADAAEDDGLRINFRTNQTIK